ncbi:MAG TPA: hypothetical protein VHM19_14490 [Polyangiales bacterium]|jgi:hypothetical protein|nr:hypothetical protein [Polyangiales bacterium]
MPEPSVIEYDVVIQRFTRGEPREWAAGLARTGMTPQLAEKLVAALPGIARRRVPASLVEGYKRALEGLGAEVQLVAAEPRPVAPQPIAATPLPDPLAMPPVVDWLREWAAGPRVRFTALLGVLCVLGGSVIYGGLQYRAHKARERFQLGGLLPSEEAGPMGACRFECASTSDACDAKCTTSSGGKSCRQGCLVGLRECAAACVQIEHVAVDPSGFTFATGRLPPWRAVLRAMLDVHDTLGQCAEDTFTVRVDVGGVSGKVRDVVVAGSVPNAKAEECVSRQIETLALPQTGKDYAFVVDLDSKVDGSKLLLRHIEREIDIMKQQKGSEAEVRTATIALWAVREEMRERSLRLEEARRKEQLERDQRAAEQGSAPTVRGYYMNDLTRRSPDRTRRPAPYVPPSGSPGSMIERDPQDDRPPDDGQSIRDLDQRLQDVQRQRAQQQSEDRAAEARRRRMIECEEWRARLIQSGEKPENLPRCDQLSYW